MIKYTLAFACSSDGFIAKYSGDNPFEWTSLEDKKHLNNLVKNHNWHRILQDYGWEKLSKQWITKLNKYSLQKHKQNSLFGSLDCVG